MLSLRGMNIWELLLKEYLRRGVLEEWLVSSDRVSSDRQQLMLLYLDKIKK